MKKRCPQCWKEKPRRVFVNARGREVTWCDECRARYRGWEKLTIDERRARMRVKKRVGTGLRVALAIGSKNRKTGPIPVSMTDMASCPTSCPLRDAGCYAEFGKARMHWEGVAGDRGVSWDEFCAAVEALPRGQLWRHNEAGDLPGLGDALNLVALRQLVTANERARARGFTFTHKPLLDDVDRGAVRDANDRGFTINLSANSLEHADELAALAIAPVAVVLPTDAPRRVQTPGGRDVVVCPAETSGLTCAECELCAKPQRKAIVGFRAHGQARAIVSDLVSLRRKEVA